MTGYNELNEHEKAYVKRQPYNAHVISECKNKAYSETRRQFGFNGRNDKTDAFRHCYWTALLSRELGYLEAIKFTTIHEMSPDNDLAEKYMDLHNNRIGAEIGKNGGGDRCIATKCIEALRQQRLIHY